MRQKISTKSPCLLALCDNEYRSVTGVIIYIIIVAINRRHMSTSIVG